MNIKQLLRILFFMVLIAVVLARGHKGHRKNRHSGRKDVKKQSYVDEEDELSNHYFTNDNEEDNTEEADNDSDEDEDDNEDEDAEAADETETAEDDAIEEYSETAEDDAPITFVNQDESIEATNDDEDIINDCDAIKSYLGVEKESSVFDCSFNEKGKLIYLYFKDTDLIEDDIDKLYSYNTVEKLEIYWTGKQYTIDKAINLSNLSYLNIFNTKGGALNLSALNTFEKMHTLEIGAPSSKDVFVKSGSFKDLKSIKYLILKQFQFSQVIIDEMGTLENIEEIKCDSCGFSNGLNFEPFKNLSKLRTIHFTSFNKYGSPIKKIPIPFTEIPTLKTLILTRQKITDIPKQLANLSNLEILNLNNNLLTSIPESLNNLQNLKEAYFSGNIKGKILTNESLVKCSYDNYDSLCKIQEMDCLGEEKLLIKFCS